MYDIMMPMVGVTGLFITVVQRQTSTLSDQYERQVKLSILKNKIGLVRDLNPGPLAP